MTLSAPFSGFPVVFCDSRDALAVARAKGLPAGAEVRSWAPALVLGGERGVVEHCVDGARLGAYWDAGGDLSVACRDAWRAGGHDEERALLAARVAMVVKQRLTRALALSEADFSDSRLYIGLRTGKDALDHESRGGVNQGVKFIM